MGCRGLTRLLRRLRRKFKSNINQQLALATERSTANALHDVQDLNARDHGPDKVRDGLQSKDFLTKDFWKHVYHDSFPSVSERSEALQNSRNLLKKAPISINKNRTWSMVRIFLAWVNDSNSRRSQSSAGKMKSWMANAYI